MFIITDKAPNDWAGANDNSLWGNFHSGDYPKQSKVYKSIFDPCPQGYRVAPKDTWVTFTSTHKNTSIAEEFNNSVAFNKGWTFYLDGWKTGSNTDFYLASGSRFRSSGVVGNVGYNSVCWSSAPDGAMDFNASIVNPLGSAPRALGCTVRCVKEP
jgi:hypothetical protein